jgi:hypothetical protein
VDINYTLEPGSSSLCQPAGVNVDLAVLEPAYLTRQFIPLDLLTEYADMPEDI